MKLKYKIALINVFWSKNDINTRYFETIAEQKTYFDNLIEGKGFSPLSNFNMNDNTETIVTFTDESGRDAETLCKTNYAVVIKTDEDDGGRELSRRYYFAYSKQDSGKQMRTMLELDDIQTNYFPNKDKIETCMINQAHLNRWIENEDGSVSFNGKADSKLFERENLKNLSQRLVKRQKMKYLSDSIVKSSNKDLIDWFNKYVDFWVYVILDEGEYTLYDDSKMTLSETNSSVGELPKIPYSVSTIVAPFVKYGFFEDSIYPTLARINLTGKFDTEYETGSWFVSSLENFLSKNGGYSKVKSVKISLKPPFDFVNDSIYYETETIEGSEIFPIKQQILKLYNEKRTNQTLLYYQDASKVYSPLNHEIFKSASDSFFLKYYYDYCEPVYLTCDLEIFKNTFEKNEIVGSNKNKDFNPKIFSEDYKSLRLSFFGSYHEISIQKLNKTNLILKYNEMITPDLSRGIARVYQNENDEIFTKEYSNSFNGFLFTLDLTIPISNGQLDLYLANNKNAFLSFANQQNLASTMFAIRSVGSMANISQNSLRGTGINIATDALSTGVQLAYNQAQFNLSIDNMRNAPDTLMNANGNVIFGDSVSPFGIYVELYEGIESELEVANDLMFKYGFIYNQFGKISDFDNERKNFNFVSANVGVISANLSDKEKERLREKLKSVRFWNSDNIDFSKENYERWLEA